MENICDFIKVKKIEDGNEFLITLPIEIMVLFIMYKLWEIIDNLEKRNKVDALIELENYYGDSKQCIEVDFEKGNIYPYIYVKNKKVFAHRYVYEKVYNENLSKDKVVMHMCDNPLCIRYSHLKIGTQKDNIKDKVKKNRQYRDRGLDKHVDNIILLKDNVNLSFEKISEIISSFVGKKVDKKTISKRYYEHKSTLTKKITQREIVLDSIDKVLEYINDYKFSFRRVGIKLSEENGLKNISGQIVKEVYIEEMKKRGLKVNCLQTKMNLLREKRDKIKKMLKEGMSKRKIAKILSEKMNLKIHHTEISKVLQEDVKIK